MRCSYPPLVFLGWVSRASRVGGPLGVCLVVFVCSPGVSLSPLGVVLVVPVVPWVVPVVAGSLTPWWGCPVLFVQPGSAWGVFVAPAGFGLWGFVSLFCVWPVRPRSVCSVLTLRGCSPPLGGYVCGCAAGSPVLRDRPRYPSYPGVEQGPTNQTRSQHPRQWRQQHQPPAHKKDEGTRPTPTAPQTQQTPHCAPHPPTNRNHHAAKRKGPHQHAAGTAHAPEKARHGAAAREHKPHAPTTTNTNNPPQPGAWARASAARKTWLSDMGRKPAQHVAFPPAKHRSLDPWTQRGPGRQKHPKCMVTP